MNNDITYRLVLAIALSTGALILNALLIITGVTDDFYASIGDLLLNEISHKIN